MALARVGHEFPQPLQFAGSVCVSVQVPEHGVSPSLQPAPHEPPKHTLPFPQALSHSPQWLGFVRVSTHTPLQREKPELQVNPQLPDVQVRVALAPVGQLLPQLPQLSTSRLVSMQTLPHFSKPLLQKKPHVPAAQVAEPFGGALHTLPQELQLVASVCVSTH